MGGPSHKKPHKAPEIGKSAEKNRGRKREVHRDQRCLIRRMGFAVDAQRDGRTPSGPERWVWRAFASLRRINPFLWHERKKSGRTRHIKTRRGVRPGFLHDFFRLNFVA